MKRPSHRELLRKIKVSRALLEAGRWAAADPVKLAANLVELDLYLRKDQQAALLRATDEITPEDYEAVALRNAPMNGSPREWRCSPSPGRPASLEPVCTSSFLWREMRTSKEYLCIPYILPGWEVCDDLHSMR
jgi:hypothetical protein